ncbi:ABC-2 type transport system ATP-binding protein [Halobiforma haloterrestris]|uniref:ABC-2 type transport system ATP-binding protein n=1 Tax=Natronobacterium haloterrestre TaxID=148448 RepID=A0A1I1JTI0_NATHA|nr:ABC transporter ATP-binding protein [Halobiforma haloterrestris]SFC51874.1 ABC-2 type transport system ATP-binding protein [Halobiforma haloterrestris]
MPAIRTDGLTKRYDGGLLGTDVTAVNDLDLVVRDGEVYGFLGPNGAGKSTTIDMLLDYGRPTSGTAELLGHDVQTESERISDRVGVLPEGYSLYDRLSGRRNLELAAEWQGVDVDYTTLLERVGLATDAAARPVGDYSKGMTQRLALAMALVGDPDLLILDEPSSGLDPNGIRRLREIVRAEAERGTTVFFSSHVLGQVEAVCDRVGILDGGELVAVDTVDGLREAAGASSVLELTLKEPQQPAVADDPAVSDVEVRGNQLRVTCTDSRAKARVVADLVDRGHELIDVDSESASLSDIFAVYTGEADVDAPTGGGKDGNDGATDDNEPAEGVIA